MRVASFNTNSVRARIPIITGWLEQHKPDILALQEIKVVTDLFPKEPFEELGYHCEVRGKPGHAGVAILSKVEPDDSIAGFNGEDADEFPRILACRFGKLHVINTYAPQGQDLKSEVFQYKLRWFKQFRAMLDERYSKRTKVLWMGDFNVAPETIDVWDSKRIMPHVDHCPEVFEALKEVRDWGFVDLFRKYHKDEEGQYTYWDYRFPGSFERNHGWRVDHIYTTKSLASKSTRCWIDKAPRAMEKASDHTFIVGEFEL
jgi:exodeoxyribonuclease III